MTIQIYFRHNHETINEYETAKKYFNTVDYRTNLKFINSTVICRYSALPFNLELEKDLLKMNCKPINSSIEHSYIADMGWIYDLEHLTFPTWFRLEDVPGNFPLIVKGKTNSRKFQWNTKMYAENKMKAIEIMHELWNDPLIGPQGTVFRKYIPLKTYEIGINGMPMTNEWRCFFYKNKLITYGYYWATLHDFKLIDIKSFELNGIKIANEAASIISENTNFFTVDVAEDINGKWWVVEINDGQMSGLNTIDADIFYKNLKEILR